MTFAEYEWFQEEMTLQMKNHAPVRREERDAFKQAILACKSAIHGMGPEFPNRFTGLISTQADIDQMVAALERIKEKSKSKTFKSKDARRAYLEGVTVCQDIISSLLPWTRKGNYGL